MEEPSEIHEKVLKSVLCEQTIENTVYRPCCVKSQPYLMIEALMLKKQPFLPPVVETTSK